MRKIPFSPPDISELEINEVIAALRSGWITTGPRTKLFENKLADYIGCSTAVCLNSCTAALELTLRILGIGPGDEVITSAYTYTASASVIYHTGAKIVLVDTAPNSYEMDYEKLADAITEKTKAVIPVDIGGVLCDYDSLYKALESKKQLYRPAGDFQELFDRIIVIADAAHSFGASYHGKKSGAVADFTCFSFHAVKNLTTAEGGAVVWRDRPGLDNDWLYRQYQLYSLHGQSKDAQAKLKPGTWEYDILFPAYKCNMTDLTAAIGLKQLERFDGLIDRRKKLAEIYDKTLLLLGVQRLEQNETDRKGNYHLYMARAPGIAALQRNSIIMKMADYGVACNVHFKPLPLLTAYKNLGLDIANYPNAHFQYAGEITLPLHTQMSEDDAQYAAQCFVECI